MLRYCLTSPPAITIVATMQFFITLLGLLSLAISTVSATALTYKLGANEKACFFADVDRADAKVAFYFAVRAYPSHTVGQS